MTPALRREARPRRVSGLVVSRRGDSARTPGRSPRRWPRAGPRCPWPPRGCARTPRPRVLAGQLVHAGLPVLRLLRQVAQGTATSSTSSTRLQQRQGGLRAGRLGHVVRHRRPERQPGILLSASSWKHADDAGRALVAWRLSPSGRPGRVAGGAGDRDRAGVRARPRAARRGTTTVLTPSSSARSNSSSQKDCQRMLGSMPRTSTTSRVAPGGAAHREAGGRPVDRLTPSTSRRSAG